MPRRIIAGPEGTRGTYQHWYSFAFPKARKKDFTRTLLGSGDRPIERVKFRNYSEKVLADIAFNSPSSRTPAYITRLMKCFDGVDIYGAVQREGLNVLDTKGSRKLVRF
jgi:hypothetical protein